MGLYGFLRGELFYSFGTIHDRPRRPRGPGFDSRRYQIFRVAVGLERGPLSPCEDKLGAT
jgi:hypothetical protein